MILLGTFRRNNNISSSMLNLGDNLCVFCAKFKQPKVILRHNMFVRFYCICAVLSWNLLLVYSRIQSMRKIFWFIYLFRHVKIFFESINITGKFHFYLLYSEKRISHTVKVLSFSMWKFRRPEKLIVWSFYKIHAFIERI